MGILSDIDYLQIMNSDMKTMTCADMGGPCDAAMTADTSGEMVAKGMQHIESAHPEMAADVKAMPQEATDQWMADFQKKWDAVPETA